jgi:hypothetical protein
MGWHSYVSRPPALHRLMEGAISVSFLGKPSTERLRCRHYPKRTCKCCRALIYCHEFLCFLHTHIAARRSAQHRSQWCVCLSCGWMLRLAAHPCLTCACEGLMSCVVASGYIEPESLLIVLGDDPIPFRRASLQAYIRKYSSRLASFDPCSDVPLCRAHPYFGDSGMFIL